LVSLKTGVSLSLNNKWTELAGYLGFTDLPPNFEMMSWILFALFVLVLLFICIHVCCLKKRSKPLKSTVKLSVSNEKVHLESFDLMLSRLREFEIRCESLNFIRDIGQGEFGRVVQAKLLHRDLSKSPRIGKSITDLEANHDELDGELDYKIVAVKMLKTTTNRVTAEQSMVREAYIMGMLANENLLGLIAVCDPGSSQMCMLVDYMAKGDLNSFLRFRSPYTNPANQPKEQDTIAMQTMLLGFAVQIANGMEYLSSQGFVHRDLATRNCLIDENLIVKISDFGMAQVANRPEKAMEMRGRNLHKNLKRAGNSDVLDSEEQQTLLQNEKLPIRWMPLEASLFQTFTIASDVWAFGILMWELFTFASFPYAEIQRNKEVIQFLLAGKRLANPDLCPGSVRAILAECWQLEPGSRPSFTTLKQQLQQAEQDINRLQKKRWFRFC
jgi:receptor tyrosine kinase